jgi:hypothetical protein
MRSGLSLVILDDTFDSSLNFFHPGLVRFERGAKTKKKTKEW